MQSKTTLQSQRSSELGVLVGELADHTDSTTPGHLQVFFKGLWLLRLLLFVLRCFPMALAIAVLVGAFSCLSQYSTC
ncbi:hypothetical protein I8748_32630 [Nostoc sp. CENA67]|uniref:Uncharacterized protein n=1 Tax=Amazonocrinis nigriterrae CENA67 TaxID=2794033 RepID=A0A8J7LAN2_9NOST|nr:hypothetical protein [Amazonocrinis nigriterrae]MBH8561798.1 hypothetical protein [Amazonocrinis nigriterrae CENA67]MBH8561971.1 hypothetical protein [Amazonocrinis nigriterrae CENA67]MBH8566839.1 hypothetical protein [Amazonocrinis nigriterrae CENA67]